MNDRTHRLLLARALLNSAAEIVDRAVDEDPTVPSSPDDREMVSVAAMIIDRLGPRSRADVLRFARAVRAGDGAWLVLQSVPGESRADASYHSHLGSDLRRALRG